MKIGICDDNKLFLNDLNETLRKLFSDSKDVIVEALNPEDLNQLLVTRVCPYDILLTDIDMGNFNGIEFAKEINVIHPSCIIIFISNYLNFATEVYEVDHIYFVLKSEVELRLPKALERAFHIYQERQNSYYRFRYQNVDYMISKLDITHIEALGRYLFIHDTQQSYKCINSLKAIAAELSDVFIKCHNSYIVNLNYIRSVSRTNCVLTSGTILPISQTYYKSFQSAYVKFVSNKLM